MATLMFKIANEPHASANVVNANMSPCLTLIIDRMLQKDPEKRYARGQEIAIALRSCADQR